MKKGGFTLIETVVSIFILSILFSVGTTLSKFSSNLTHEMENKNCAYEIQNLYLYGRAVCLEKNKYGKITVDSIKNEIRFIEGWDKIERIIKLPKEIKMFTKDESVLIRPGGKIEQGNTITLVHKYGEKQEIKIRVGVDLILIKESENL